MGLNLSSLVPESAVMPVLIQFKFKIYSTYVALSIRDYYLNKSMIVLQVMLKVSEYPC